MAVRKDEKSGKWLAEAYIKGKRIRKQFDSKGEANRFYSAIKQENSPLAELFKNKSAEASLRLQDLIQMWYEYHGQTIQSGKDIYSKLLLICDAMNNPIASQFGAEHYVEYRRKRLEGEIVYRKTVTVGPTILNYELTLLKAVFNELKRANKWKHPNPLAHVKKIKSKEPELSFLRSDEIEKLLKVTSEKSDIGIIIRICLATGARWSEAQNLKSSQIIPHKITFTQTKNGKNRSVPISPDLYEIIPKGQGSLFKKSYEAFRWAIEKAGIVLPKGQLSHVLRHTFASHFMMNGGNILVLKEILGHSDIQMTMRYAHFAPSYLESAITLNPLSNPAKI